MERSADGGDTPVSAALDALAASMDLGLLLIDSNGRPAFSNRTALELLGCREGDAVGFRWAALQSVMTLQAGGAPLAESASRAFTADLPLEGRIRCLRGEIRPAGGGSAAFLKDRRSLGKLDIELLCASRMREWIHQCEGRVHDANGALNSIQFALELLVGELPGQEAREQVREPRPRNHLTVIRDNLEKLKVTLRQLLSAHDATTASAFDLRGVVKETASTLRMPSRRRGIDLQTPIADKALRVNGNRARIRQALVNVALTRLDALSERSSLTLEANAHGEGFEIVCRDEGSLAETARAGIFQVLLAESGAGSGTDALRLARAIVESEAGEFQVRNDAGSGTVFRFLFRQAAA